MRFAAILQLIWVASVEDFFADLHLVLNTRGALLQRFDAVIGPIQSNYSACVDSNKPRKGDKCARLSPHALMF